MKVKQKIKPEIVIIIVIISSLLVAIGLSLAKYIFNDSTEVWLQFYEYRISQDDINLFNKDNICLSTNDYTKDEVTVEITTEEPCLSIQYKLGNSENWNDYTEKIIVTENTKIMARLVAKDSEGNLTFNGPITEKDITNISVAKIENTYYKTLEKAIQACPENAGDSQTKIEMLLDVEESVTVSETQNILLDLNGKTVTGVNESTITNSGTLTISGELGTITCSGADTITNTGTVEIRGGTIESDTVNGVTNNEKGNVKISGGKINGVVGVRNNSLGTINVSGDVKIIGTNGSGIVNELTGTINVSGTAYIEGRGGHGINNSNQGTINVTETPTIIGAINGIRGYVGTINVSGGTIIGGKDGINVTSAEISNTIFSGSASVTGGTIIGGRIGIIAGSGNASITLGKKGKNVSSESPVIISTNTSTEVGHGHGIYLEQREEYGNATLYFYDGIIYAQTQELTLNGTVTEVEPNYQIVYGTKEYEGTMYKTAYLGNEVVFDFNTANNMNKWDYIYPERLNVTYNSSTRMNDISFTGASGYELISIPIQTVAGNTYKISFDYKNNIVYTGLNSSTGIKHEGITYQVLNAVPKGNTNFDTSIQYKYLPTELTEGRYELEFEATGEISYLVINFGTATDNMPINVNLGNFVISEVIEPGQELGQLPSLTLAETTFNGYYTTRTGGDVISDTTTVGTNPGTYYAQITQNNNYQNIRTNEYYATMQEAFQLASSDDTIKVINEITEVKRLGVPESKILTLDLNGKTTILDGVTLTNNGELTIIGTGKITSNITTIVNNGNLTLVEGEVNSTTSNGSTIHNYGDLEIDNATVSATNTSATTARAIYNFKGGKIKITGVSASINGITHGITNYDQLTDILNPSIYISNGTIEAASSTSYGIANHGGSIVMTNGSVTGNYAICNADADSVANTVKITGGTVIGLGETSGSYAIKLNSTFGIVDTLILGENGTSGPTITCPTSSIYLNVGNLQMYSGTVSSNNNYAILSSKHDGETVATITGGTISSNENYAIYTASGTGDIIIGTANSNDNNQPTIVNGIYSESCDVTFNSGNLNVNKSSGYGIITNANVNITGGNLTTNGNVLIRMGSKSSNKTLNISGNPILTSTSVSEHSVVYVVEGQKPTIKVSGGILKSELGRGISANDADVIIYGNTNINSITAAVYTTTGNVTIKASENSNTSEETTGPVIKSNTYGVYIRDGGTLTLGTNESVPNVSITNPSITGSTCGVYVGTGTFNFYDGIIRGPSENSILGTVTATPTGYTVMKGTEEIDGITYETSVLSEMYVAESDFSLQETMINDLDSDNSEMDIEQNNSESEDIKEETKEADKDSDSTKDENQINDDNKHEDDDNSEASQDNEKNNIEDSKENNIKEVDIKNSIEDKIKAEKAIEEDNSEVLEQSNILEKVCNELKDTPYATINKTNEDVAQSNDAQENNDDIELTEEIVKEDIIAEEKISIYINMVKMRLRKNIIC